MLCDWKQYANYKVDLKNIHHTISEINLYSPCPTGLSETSEIPTTSWARLIELVAASQPRNALGAHDVDHFGHRRAVQPRFGQNVIG